MQKIVINPRYPMEKIGHPLDTDYPQVIFLISERFAVASDGRDVNLVGVVPDDAVPGAYRMQDDWDEYVSIGIDDKRTVKGLAEIVDKLKSISGYELLTKHYRNSFLGPTFYVNRDSSYIVTYEDDQAAPPVNELNPPTGGDY